MFYGTKIRNYVWVATHFENVDLVLDFVIVLNIVDLFDGKLEAFHVDSFVNKTKCTTTQFFFEGEELIWGEVSTLPFEVKAKSRVVFNIEWFT